MSSTTWVKWAGVERWLNSFECKRCTMSNLSTDLSQLGFGHGQRYVNLLLWYKRQLLDVCGLISSVQFRRMGKEMQQTRR